MSDYAPSIETVWDALPLGKASKDRRSSDQDRALEISSDLRADRRRARAKDPATSHEAADRAKRFDAEHYQRILQAIGEGELGISAIAERSGLDRAQVFRRMAELRAGGLVIATTTVTNGRGSRESVYRRLPR